MTGTIARCAGTNTTISSVALSYAFKLLLQEMMSLGLVLRLRLKDKLNLFSLQYLVFNHFGDAIAWCQYQFASAWRF